MIRHIYLNNIKLCSTFSFPRVHDSGRPFSITNVEGYLIDPKCVNSCVELLISRHFNIIARGSNGGCLFSKILLAISCNIFYYLFYVNHCFLRKVIRRKLSFTFGNGGFLWVGEGHTISL